MAIQYASLEPVDSSDSEDARDSDENASTRSVQSDTSSDIIEVDEADIPSYFQERNGHLFHSHGSSPYPLPVDTSEQQRQHGQHVLLRLLLGSNYLGSVHRVLRPGAQRQRRVCDLGTGTGEWVIEMAHEFPHVRFDGLDIVPIATRRPPDNVWFEMADINAPLRYDNGAFDVVHARSISMAVYDYSGMVDQVARVLRPGGLFLACEWGRSAAMRGNRDPAIYAPYTYAFYHTVNDTLASIGILPLASRLEGEVLRSGHFDRIRSRVHEMPIGDWPANDHFKMLGVAFRNVLTMYAASMRVMMLDAGRHRQEVDMLVGGFIRELYEVPYMVCKYHTVRARKVRG